MATVSKKQIGIDARRKTAEGRFYQILKDKDYISITNALESINKPAIGPWMAKVERELCTQVAANLFMDAPVELDALWQAWDEIAPNDKEAKDKAAQEAMAAYSAALGTLIGKQKAGIKLLNAAAEIGTDTHSLIEYWARVQLGLSVGPRPKVGDKSEWGFMAFEDWAKEHQFKPIASEMVVFSHEHEIAGTLDLLGYVDGFLKIVDIKTGKAVYGEAKLQCSAYWKCLIQMGHKCSDSAIVLRLPKIETDPEFEAVEVDNLPAYFDTFLHAKELRLWQIAEEKEYKSKIEAAKEIA